MREYIELLQKMQEAYRELERSARTRAIETQQLDDIKWAERLTGTSFAIEDILKAMTDRDHYETLCDYYEED